jgi:hypothetical protein
MPWVRLDDRFPSHRKVALLSDRAFRLYVSALCWCSENLTEGRILDRELPVVTRIRGAKAAAADLEAAGLWDRIEGGWQVHDYLEYNPDRSKVQAERAANAARQQAFRDRKRAEREAEKAARNASRNGVTTSGKEQQDDTTATATRHDGDTNARRSGAQNHASSQVDAFRNGVSNGTPSPYPSPTPFTPYGENGAPTTTGQQERPAAYPDRLTDLKQAIAAAGIAGIDWQLKPSQWEYARQAVERVGIPAMVAYAVNSVRLKGAPSGASAWIGGWRSLEAPPENGVTYLPAVVNGPPRPSTTDQRVQQAIEAGARVQAMIDARKAQQQ